LTVGAVTRLLAVTGLVTLLAAVAAAQTPAPKPAGASVEPAKDSLGRDTPRGTVMWFLAAARQGDAALAAQYLNTTLQGEAAEELAHELFVILDTRLPARLALISAESQGSRANPLEPNRELIGKIKSARGDVAIVVERVNRQPDGAVWLFSRATLDAVPALYDEVSHISIDSVVPKFLTNTRVGGIRLFDWLSLLVGLPFLYLLTVLLNRLLSPLIGLLWHRVRGRREAVRRDLLPTPFRLLLLGIAIRWLATEVQLPILARQFWLMASTLINVAAVVWLLMLLNGRGEQLVRRRVPRFRVAAAASLLRLARRFADGLVIFAGVLVVLHRLGVDPTPALAGLGVGGIAVALAAQKTLENVIAGVSLIFDRAVSEGDFLKAGDTLGTVEHIGLRSTRIRTLDRTVVSVPNSQIANMSLETLSARDMYWFHPIVGLRYETTPEQLRAVIDGIRQRLADHGSVDRSSLRVRFLRLGAFSLDVEVFAYLVARDWVHFLEIQEALLFTVMDIVREAGTQVAFPSQTLYMAGPEGRSVDASGSSGSRVRVFSPLPDVDRNAQHQED
jgi:MscS family membrane protein